MAKAQLFEARKGTVVIETPDGEPVVVRDGLTPSQAKTLAMQLNTRITDLEDLNPTRREQKFSVHFTGSLEFTTYDDAFYTVADVREQVMESLQALDPVDAEYESPKVKVTVKKIYDKQVPND